MSEERFGGDREPPALSSAQVEVAGIVVALRPGGAKAQAFRIPPFYVPFLGGGTPDLVLTYYLGAIPPGLAVGDLLFDEGHLWSLHQSGSGLLWRQPSIRVVEAPNRVAIFRPDLSAGDVYLARAVVDDGSGLYPLYHPLDRFVYDTLLAGGRGVGCHACGVDDGGRGLLFVGESGAGKSTMAELWHRRAGVTVLSDERTVLRRQEGQGWRIYGTPWHGTAGLFSPASAPLAAICFLEQAGSNRVAEVRPAEAARRLLVCAYLPFWFRAGMEVALQFLAGASQEVPCYELGFEAEGSVVDFVRRLG